MLRRHRARPRPLALVALAGITAVLAVANLGAAAAATFNVTMADNTFTPQSITIAAGDTVVWTDTGARPHTVTADDASFDSGNMSTGQTFSRTFSTPGTIRYFCKIHGAAGGVGMAGTIIVQAAQVSTTTTTAAPSTTTTDPAAAVSSTSTTSATTTTAATVAAAEAPRNPASSSGAGTADASGRAATPTAAQPTGLASTGFGPYTAALTAIGLALLLTGAVVVRQTRLSARSNSDRPPA